MNYLWTFELIKQRRTGKGVQVNPFDVFEAGDVIIHKADDGQYIIRFDNAWTPAFEDDFSTEYQDPRQFFAALEEALVDHGQKGLCLIAFTDWPENIRLVAHRA